MYCTNCGQKIDEKAIVCVHCGVPTPLYNQTPKQNQYATPAKRSRIVGFILSFFYFLSLPALIVSILEFQWAKKEGTTSGFALTGIILSACQLAFIVLIIFINLVMY